MFLLLLLLFLSYSVLPPLTANRKEKGAHPSLSHSIIALQLHRHSLHRAAAAAAAAAVTLGYETTRCVFSLPYFCFCCAVAIFRERPAP